MSSGAYAIGVGALLVSIAGAWLFARLVRAALLSGGDALETSLVDVMLTVITFVVVGEALGTVDELRRGAFVLVMVGLGLVGLFVPGRPRLPSRWRPITTPQWSGPAIVAAATVTLVVAQYVASFDSVLRGGITFTDATGYHLTTAAHFATSHSTRGYIHTVTGDQTTYYPFNDEMLHGIGMLLLSRDSLSLLLPGLDVTLFLLSFFAVGRRIGVPTVAICGAGPLLVTIGAFTAQAMNDWASIWPMLVAAAVFVATGDRRLRRGELLVIGLGLGLALGTKVDLAVPVIVLSLCIVWLTRGARPASVALLVAGGVISGGYWYVRDWILVGSPVPALHLPGLHHVPMSLVDNYGYSIAHYLTNAHVIRHFFLAYSRLLLGDAWPALIVLGAIGLSAGLTRGVSPQVRVLSITSAAGVIAYVVTPTSAAGPRNLPVFFPENVRYVYPAAALSLLLVCASRPARRYTFLTCLFLLAVSSTTAATSHYAWPPGGTDRPLKVTAACLCAAVAVALAVQLRRSGAGTQSPQGRLGPHFVAIASVLTIVTVAAAGFPLQRFYLDHRYNTDFGRDLLFAPLDDKTHISIGVTGRAELYPLLDPQWRNRVSYIGESLPGHAYEDYPTCAGFRAAAGRFDFVVVETIGKTQPVVALPWLRHDPDASLIFKNWAGEVFAMKAGYSTKSCPPISKA